MTITLSSTATRRTAWMLALSPLAFVVLVATVLAIDSGPMSELSAARLANIAGMWIAYHVVYLVAVVWGAWCLVRLDRTLSGPLPRISGVFAVLGVLAGVALAVVRIAMLGAGSGRIGDLGTFPVASVLSMLAVWCVAVATVLTAVALSTEGMLRRTGLVVAVLGGLYVVADVVSGGGFPPFTVALLWLAVGVALLVRRVPSA